MDAMTIIVTIAGIAPVWKQAQDSRRQALQALHFSASQGGRHCRTRQKQAGQDSAGHLVIKLG